jgi:hypothetical protein
MIWSGRAFSRKLPRTAQNDISFRCEFSKDEWS